MNKTELISQVAQKSGLAKKDASAAVSAVFELISESLENKEKVQLLGFGTFEARVRAERAGHDPKTGKSITIAESVQPVFKAGKTLKQALNK